MKRSPFIHSLRRAMIVLGSRDQLAERLDVSPEQLSTWLRGELAPPQRPYLAALAIVSGVPAESMDWRRPQEAE